MSGERGLQFVDTNVLVYAHDVSSGPKRESASELLSELWDRRLGCLSIQVLQEFYVAVTRKVSQPLDPREAKRLLEVFGCWTVHSPDVQDVLAAADIRDRHRIAFWDSMIIRSAQRTGCRVLWSEDLQAGQDYGGLTVRNPFFV